MSVKDTRMFLNASSPVLKSANKVSRYAFVSSISVQVHRFLFLGPGDQPKLRAVCCLPLCAHVLLHPLLQGVHGPGRQQQVPKTGRVMAK